MKKILYPALASILFVSCTNSDSNTEPVTTIATPDAPKSVGYSIVRTYPHDTSSFTQGLILYKGELYEGTGEYGRSHLMKVNLGNGRIEKKISLDPKYFGEGITILRDTVYQLTWQEKTVFAYTLKDLKKIKEFSVDTEGWGI